MHPSMSLGTDHTPCHTCTLASSLLSAYIGPRSILCLLTNNPVPGTRTITRRWSPAGTRRPTDQQTTTDGFGSGLWDQRRRVSDLARLVLLLAHFAFMSQTTIFPPGIRPLTFSSISQDWGLLSTRGIHNLVYKKPNPSAASPRPTLPVFHFPCIFFTLNHPHP